MPLINASRLAAQAGSESKSFLTNVDAANLSCVNTVNLVVANCAASWSGVSVQKVTTSIVSSQYSTGVVTIQQTPLTVPANTSTYAYNCQVVLQGTLQPLFKMDGGMFNGVPGLGAPIQTTTRSEVVFENTQGLNQ
jgi:hypothetical protein